MRPLSRNYAILFVFLTGSLLGTAQSMEDSLTALLNQAGLADTARVDILNKLAWQLKHQTPGRSLQYAKDALAIAQAVEYKRGEGESYNQVGINYTIMGDYAKGLENFLNALPVLEAAGEKALTANTLNNIGNSYQLRGNADQARIFFGKALRIRTELMDTTSLYASYNSLAILHKDQLQFDSALLYFRKYLNNAEYQGDSRKISVASNNLGLVLRNQGRYDSALIFFNQALDIKKEINDEQGIALSYRNIGDVFNEKGDVGNALDFYRQAVAIRERIGYNLGLTVLLKDIAEMLRRSGRFREATDYASRSLMVARQSKMKPEEASALEALSAVFEARGDFKRSLQYHREFFALKDSLLNADKSRQLSELQVKYETEQKENELLAQSKAIAVLEVQTAADSRTKIILALGSLFLAGMLVLLYSRFQLKKQSEQALTRKNQEIALKNREIEEINKELEQRMLRAQMDPHFIFNCLNSIQHFITVNDKVSALKYLSKFSKLVRQVLENSVNTIVPLADELRLLELYIELETLRFDHKFEHAIEVDPALDLHNTEVPFLLIQPYVENAIQHGLRHRPSGGKLFISVSKSGGSIRCTVEDNGIGRKQASRINGTNRSAHPSRGMSLAEQRLALLNKKQSRKTLVNIQDLYDRMQSSGTKVTITIPTRYDD